MPPLSSSAVALATVATGVAVPSCLSTTICTASGSNNRASVRGAAWDAKVG